MDLLSSRSARGVVSAMNHVIMLSRAKLMSKH